MSLLYSSIIMELYRLCVNFWLYRTWFERNWRLVECYMSFSFCFSCWVKKLSGDCPTRVLSFVINNLLGMSFLFVIFIFIACTRISKRFIDNHYHGGSSFSLLFLRFVIPFYFYFICFVLKKGIAKAFPTFSLF